MTYYKLIAGSCVFLLVVFLHPLKGQAQQIQLNKQEIECLKKTQVDIAYIKRDKAPNAKPQYPVDPTFNEYLQCYVEKLRSSSKLHGTMSPYIYIPGYRTKLEIPNIKCNEKGEHVSGLPIPCVIS